MRSLLYLHCACAVAGYKHGGHTCTRDMYTPFAHAFAYAIKQTPYAFVAKIILCMYLLYDTGLHRSVAILYPIGLLFALRHCNPVCAAEQKSLRFVGGMKSNPVCAVLGNAKCNQQIRSAPVTELYLIYLKMALSNKRRSQKHGGLYVTGGYLADKECGVGVSWRGQRVSI